VKYTKREHLFFYSCMSVIPIINDYEAQYEKKVLDCCFFPSQIKLIKSDHRSFNSNIIMIFSCFYTKATNSWAYEWHVWFSYLSVCRHNRTGFLHALVEEKIKLFQKKKCRRKRELLCGVREKSSTKKECKVLVRNGRH